MNRGKRETRSILVVAALAATVMLAACPPSAGAKPKPPPSSRGLFGTTIWEPPTTEEFQRMAQGGLSHMKLLITPALVAAQGPGARDWRLYDQIVGDAARSGISIDPWLFGVPAWISNDTATLPLRSPSERSFWTSFVHDAATRYGPGGQFWAQNPSLAARPMRDWEVWNEPNINEFNGTGARASAFEFARLLRLTRSGLQSASPENRIVLGGLYRRPKPGHGIRMSRFLQRLYKLKRGRSLFDLVAIHPYAARPPQVLRVTRSVRRVMNANRDGRKPIWITELGWTTGGTYWAQSLYRATLAQQAARVGRTARLLLANRRLLRLRRVDWHTWRDYPGNEDIFWDKSSGLFTADGHPKPAWAAFTQVTGGVAGGQIRNVGHFQPPLLPLVPVTPTTPKPPPPPAPPPPSCLLPGLLC